MKHTDTTTLAAAMDILARDIHCEDGVATAAIADAAERLRELERENAKLRERLRTTHKCYLMAQGICEEIADAEARSKAAT